MPDKPKEFNPYWKDYLKNELCLSPKQIKIIKKASKGIFPKQVETYLSTLPHRDAKTETTQNNQERITNFMNKKYGPLMSECFMAAVYYYLQPDEVAFLRNLTAINDKKSSLTN